MTLVFIHGAGCTSEIFANQLAAFPGSIAVKLPGHDAPGSASSIAEFADAVATELQTRNLQDVVLCGFSMGGAIALELALRREPRVRALALLDTGSRLRVSTALLDLLEADFEKATAVVARNLYAEEQPERIERSRAMMRVVGQTQCHRDFSACNAFDVTERLGEIALPTIAISGELDAMTPPKYAQALADRIPGASARIVPGAGHLAVVERPGEMNEAIRAFVTDFNRSHSE